MEPLHSTVLLVLTTLTSSSGGLRWKGGESRETRKRQDGCHWEGKDVWQDESDDPAGEIQERCHPDQTCGEDGAWYDGLAAEMFALVVFVSDGLLQVKVTTSSPAARFISIAAQLPLELQMVLCLRQMGSDKEIIPGKESEVAFKELAKRLW